MDSRSEQLSRHDLHHQIKDAQLDGFVKQASIQFNQFTNTGYKAALKFALSLMMTAINICKTRGLPLHDLAYCHRRFASIVIRDNSIEDRYLLARNALDSALSIYSQTSDHDEVQLLEVQRTLHQMRKVAYELKDGKLLEKVIGQFLPLAQLNPATNYLEDCYESLFHLHFAFSRFDRALEVLQDSKKITEKDNLGTLHCHEIKTHLAILQTSDIADKKAYFEQHIEKSFWTIYDESKKALTNERMMKQLILLFSIRCQRSLLGMTWGRRPIEYVLYQASGILGNPHYQQLRKTLRMKIETIRNSHFLPLDYAFFKDVSVPGIVITNEAIDVMFPPRPQGAHAQLFRQRDNDNGHTTDGDEVVTYTPL